MLLIAPIPRDERRLLILVQIQYSAKSEIFVFPETSDEFSRSHVIQEEGHYTVMSSPKLRQKLLMIIFNIAD